LPTMSSFPPFVVCEAESSRRHSFFFSWPYRPQPDSFQKTRLLPLFRRDFPSRELFLGPEEKRPVMKNGSFPLFVQPSPKLPIPHVLFYPRALVSRDSDAASLSSLFFPRRHKRPPSRTTHKILQELFFYGWDDFCRGGIQLFEGARRGRLGSFLTVGGIPSLSRPPPQKEGKGFKHPSHFSSRLFLWGVTGDILSFPRKKTKLQVVPLFPAAL